MIETGMIVRYAPRWCSKGEQKYLHIVKENLLNPCTNEMSRWLIETINMENMVFHPTEVVDDYMIEPTGFTIAEFERSREDGIQNSLDTKQRTVF